MFHNIKKFFLHKNILHSYTVLDNLNPEVKNIFDSAIMTFYFIISIIITSSLHIGDKKISHFLVFNIILFLSYIFKEYFRDGFLFVKHSLIKRKFEKTFIHNPDMIKILMDYIEFKKLTPSYQNIIINNLAKEKFSLQSITIIHNNYYKSHAANIKEKLLETTPTNQQAKDILSSNLHFFSQNSNK